MRMQLIVAIAVITLLVATPILGQAPAAPAPTIPIEGLDAVMLVQGKEMQGKESIAVVRGRFKYIFATEENKAAFEKEEERYAVQMNGLCARMGAPVRGNPDLWTVHEGKIYLFGTDNCVRDFKASPKDYIEPAHAPWPASPAEWSRGRALLDKAVAAMGGAQFLDSLTSFHEKRTQKAKRRDGTDYDATTEILRAFPDGLRQVQVRQFGTVTTVFAGASGFVQFQSGDRSDLRSAPADAREQMEVALLQDPFFLLQSRNRADFRVAAGGTGKVGDIVVEWVHAETRGQRYTLGIEPASGRLLSVSLVARGTAGKFGDLTLQFLDYRSSGGLSFPHRVDALFKGQPLPEASYTITEVEINKPVDTAVFERPKSTS